MHWYKRITGILAGGFAGAINGIFGAGGGMVLVPMLSLSKLLTEKQLFSSSIVIILPICITSLLLTKGTQLPWAVAWPYMLGGGFGGVMAAKLGPKLPVTWLHRGLGVLIIYGGIRYLC